MAMSMSSSTKVAVELLLRRACAGTTSISARAHMHSSVPKTVLISQSGDAATNLALQEWLYTRLDGAAQRPLLVCRNDASGAQAPTVSLGATGNAWQVAEREVKAAEDKDGVVVVRRAGDGAAVYQDAGVLQMTWMGERNEPAPAYCAGLVTRALFRAYGLRVRGADLLQSTSKFVESSQRHGEKYSSFTNYLYVNVDKTKMNQAMERDEAAFEFCDKSLASATGSGVLNLIEINPRITVDGLLGAIGHEFLRTRGATLHDGGAEYARQQLGFQMVNPTEKWFPGITEIRDRLVSWQYVYGSTPAFTVSRAFPLRNVDDAHAHHNSARTSRVTVSVRDGRVAHVRLATVQNGDATVITALTGQPFSAATLQYLETMITGTEPINLYQQQRQERDVPRDLKKMSSVNC